MKRYKGYIEWIRLQIKYYEKEIRLLNKEEKRIINNVRQTLLNSKVIKKE